MLAVLQLVELGDLRDLLARARPGPLLEACVLYLSGAVTGSLAWMVCLRPLGYRLHLLPALRLTLTGFVLNNLVPGGVAGDVYRVYALGEMGVPRAEGAVSVVVERWAALLALLVTTAISCAVAWPLLTQASLVLGWLPPALLRLDRLMALVLVLLLAAFAGTVWAALTAARRGQVSETLRLGAPVRRFLAALDGFRAHPGAFLAATAVNLWSPLLEGLAFSRIAEALGLDLSPLLFLVFTPLFRAVNHLPVSVNAVGTQELASIALWNPMGASHEAAVGISLLMHALKVLVSLIGVPLYYLPIRYRVAPQESGAFREKPLESWEGQGFERSGLAEGSGPGSPR